MSLHWLRSTMMGLVAALGFAAALTASPPGTAQPSTFLTGQFLIASTEMGDPRFERTVILMIRHDRDGAFGLIVNRPIREEPLSRLLEILGEKGTTADGKVQLFYGGPVQPELGFIIHSTDYKDASTREVDGHVAMTSSREIILAIANNTGPKKSLIVFGYAGWAPGQLEGEIARRGWVTAPADLGLIFDEDREKVWERAYARRTQDL